MTENPNAFKHWFDLNTVQRLGDMLAAAGPFDVDAFVGDAGDGLLDLELKDRVRLIADAIHRHLPDDYPRAVAHLLAALPPADDDTEAVTSGMVFWPFCHFVETRGLDHIDVSLDAMEELTQRFSAEFAIRPFLDRHPDYVLGWLAERVTHPSAHVRRWVSEGTRPRLPWGMRLSKFVDDPTPLLPLLEALRNDESEYVRRSVTNNLNDIAKDHPEVVVDVTRRWWPDADDDDGRRLIKHALRTLIKQGHTGALDVLGFGAPSISGATLTVPDTVEIGESFEMRLALRADASHAVILDYAVHHVRSDGSRSAKVFKWTTRELDAEEELTLEKKHSMRVVTTRRYFPGEHLVEVMANGEVIASASFELLAAR